jgi:hypothetical protein
MMLNMPYHGREGAQEMVMTMEDAEVRGNEQPGDGDFGGDEMNDNQQDQV